MFFRNDSVDRSSYSSFTSSQCSNRKGSVANSSDVSACHTYKKSRDIACDLRFKLGSFFTLITDCCKVDRTVKMQIVDSWTGDVHQLYDAKHCDKCSSVYFSPISLGEK